jgi:hypothetical protein
VVLLGEVEDQGRHGLPLLGIVHLGAVHLADGDPGLLIYARVVQVPADVRRRVSVPESLAVRVKTKQKNES